MTKNEAIITFKGDENTIFEFTGEIRDESATQIKGFGSLKTGNISFYLIGCLINKAKIIKIQEVNL